MLEKKKSKKKKLMKEKWAKALQTYALQGLKRSMRKKEKCLAVDIRIEGPSVAEFNPPPGVQFWWASGTRMRRSTFNN